MKLRAQVNTATGKAKHYLSTVIDSKLVRGQQFPTAAWVEISEQHGAFFLNRFDADGNFLTDTWHETLEDAKGQASFEYCIAENDWTATGAESENPDPP
jgi:hypothetical protein